MIRVGYGYDLHRLVEGRKLVLAGVTIPHDKGLLGHSDADVLFHAICDALLGATGLGDIGRHFPDTNMAYKDVSSTLFVKETMKMIVRKGYQVGNVDATILAEVPKIAPYSEAMKTNLAVLLRIEPDCVNIKASTTEGIGTIGQEKAIAAHCVATVFRSDQSA